MARNGCCVSSQYCVEFRPTEQNHSSERVGLLKVLMVGWDGAGTLWGRLTPTVSGAPEVVRGRKAAGPMLKGFTRDKLSCRTGSPHQRGCGRGRGRGRSIRAPRGLPSAHISLGQQGQLERRRGPRAEGQGRGQELGWQHLTWWRNKARP